MSPPDQSLPGPTTWERQPVVVQWELAAPRGAALRQPTWHDLAGGTNELDTAEAERMIRDLAANGVSSLVLVQHGGSLRDDLPALLRLAAGEGLETWLVGGSAEAFTEELAGELGSAGLAGFSARIDTPTPDQHDKVAVAALRIAESAGLLLCAETYVNRWNIELLPAIRDAVGALGVSRWHLVYPVSDVSAMPTAAQVEVSLRELVRVESQLDFLLELTAVPQFHRVYAASGAEEPTRARALGDGRGQLFVSYCGDIFPSPELPVPCGNLRIHDLLDVYRFHPTFRTLRDPTVLRGRCDACEYQRTCGGSRARAYALHGSLLGGDVLCVHSPQALLRKSFP